MDEARDAGAPRGIRPQTDILVRFSGRLYKWILELKPQLRDAKSEEDVPAIAVELLYRAIGKEIQVGTGPDADVYNLWR